MIEPHPRKLARALILILAASAAAGCVQSQAAAPAALDEPPVPTTSAEAEPGATLFLALDEPTFWHVPHVVALHDTLCRIRDVTLEPSLAYTLEVPEGAHELRVAAERTEVAPCVRPFLLDPHGAFVAPPPGMLPYTEGSLMLSQEIIVPTPAPGAWTLGLMIQGSDIDIRLRALARSAPPTALPEGIPLLPDLRPAPPFELKFQFPTSIDPGPTPLPAHGPLSCSPEEVVQNGAPVPCLRFSFGAGNLGPGPLQLHYTSLGPHGLPRPATQWIFQADGTHEEHPAGQVVLHTSHGHYHWDDSYVATLYAVTPEGAPASVSTSFKISGCLGDFMLTAWENFESGPLNAGGTSNACLGIPLGAAGPAGSPLVRTEENIGLTPGWMDVYPSTLPDNYVAFPDGDGEYVLVFAMDPKNLVLEADETNNHAYAWFRVTGQEIEILERAYGRGPDDPARIVVPAPWVT